MDSTGAALVAIPFGTGLPQEGSKLVKVSSTGEVVWSKSWLGAQVRSVAVGPANSVLVTGWFWYWNSVDFGGGPLTNAGLEDIFLVALEASGDWSWNRRFGSGGTERASSLAIDSVGNIVLAGDFNGGLDFGTGTPLASVRDPTRFGPSDDLFIAKLDPSGEGIWSRQYGDPLTNEAVASMAVDASGAVVVSGNGGSLLDFGLGPFLGDAAFDFIVRFDSAGHALWNRALPSSGASVATLPSSVALVAGEFPRDLDFPGSTRTFVGGSDVFVLEYAP